MIDDFLFEINCAEEIGDYVLADNLSNKLVRLASANHYDVKRKIQRRLGNQNGIKDISFSQSLQKFIVSANSSIDYSVKRKIKNLAEPFGVRFKFSGKTMNNPLRVSNIDPLDEHLEELKQLGPKVIEYDKFNEMEPNLKQLRITSEFPADENCEDTPEIQFLLDLARIHALKNINH